MAKPLHLLAVLLLTVAGCDGERGTNTAKPSSGPSLTSSRPASKRAADIKLPPGNDILIAATGGRGSTRFAALQKGGDVTFVIACKGSGVRIARRPDIEFSIGCSGLPHNVTVDNIAISKESVELHADAQTEWALGAVVHLTSVSR